MNKISIENNNTPTSHSFLNSSRIGIRPSRQSPNGHASMSSWLVARGNKIWNRNQLKLFVVCTMLLDHAATALFDFTSLIGQIMWFFGMFTAPTMAYFVAEGYHYTRNFKKYILRMGIFALLSWLPYYYFRYGTLPFIDGNYFILPFSISKNGYQENMVTGVIYTFFIALLAIWLWDKATCPKWCKIIGVLLLALLSGYGDWGMYGMLCCFFFYIFRENPKKKWIIYYILTALFFSRYVWSCYIHHHMEMIIYYLHILGLAFVPLLIEFVYNGQSGKRNGWIKWLFYIVYPINLIVFGIIRW